MNINLSPELISFARKEIEIKQYFETVEVCTANDILYKQFIESTKWKGLPKLIFYIVMDEEYGQCDGKNFEGNLGRFLKIKK